MKRSVTVVTLLFALSLMALAHGKEKHVMGTVTSISDTGQGSLRQFSCFPTCPQYWDRRRVRFLIDARAWNPWPRTCIPTRWMIRSAATSGYKRDTVLSSDGGRRGTLLPFRTCFQKWPQVQDQRSSLLEQPHSGHRIRGPDGSSLFS